MVILMMVLTMVGCSTLDCPLNNTTYTCLLYTSPSPRD